MHANPYDSYLESQVLTASPLELVEMIYRAAIEAIRTARVKLADGDVRGRALAITRAMNLVGELVQSLDLEAGGNIAADLRDLYDFVLRRLQTGNFEQTDAPLAEAERLLVTLLDGWQAAASSQRPVTPIASGPFEAPAEEFRSTVSLSC